MSSASPDPGPHGGGDPGGAYLDHAASSPMRPEVLEAMLPWLRGEGANPSGSHRAARAARRAVEAAREVVADALGVAPGEVIMTSGGTESDNLAVAGAIALGPGSVVVSAVEHPAVAEAAARHDPRVAPVHPDGTVDLDGLAEMLAPDVALVSVMAVNNELGTVQPVGEVADLVADRCPDAVLHTDAVQALPWLDLRATGARVDAVSISAHKLGGPKGVGALAWRDGRPLAAQVVGGGQERGRRSGTLNVAGIVGLGAAVAATDAARTATVDRVGRLRDRLVAGVLSEVDGIETAVGESGRSHKVAGNAHLCFPGVESEALLFLLDQAGVAASAASSCASGAQQASPVLAAIGLDPVLARGALRLSLGWSTSDAEVDHACHVVVDAVTRLRETGS